MKNNNKKYIGLVVAVLAVGLLVYLNGGKSPTPSSDVKNSSDIVLSAQNTQIASETKSSAKVSSSPVIKDGSYIISYTNNGFNPKNLEISRGKSVRFLNDSGKAMRVASYDPSNIQLPQTLSQPKTVGKGGTYEFTFNDIGTFPYANLNNTADRGTVVVK